MAQHDPQTVADRWAQNLGSATAKIQSGVQSVTTSPAQSAAAHADLWQQRIADPATKAKFQASLSRISLADWQQAMLGKGLNRISSGAQAAKPKFASFLSSFLPFIEGVASRVRQMPKATLEDRINRAVAQIRGASGYRRSGQ